MLRQDGIETEVWVLSLQDWPGQLMPETFGGRPEHYRPPSRFHLRFWKFSCLKYALFSALKCPLGTRPSLGGLSVTLGGLLETLPECEPPVSHVLACWLDSCSIARTQVSVHRK